MITDTSTELELKVLAPIAQMDDTAMPTDDTDMDADEDMDMDEDEDEEDDDSADDDAADAA